MTRVLLDGSAYELPASASTWGDLLGRIDGEAAGRGLIVSDVRFDGVDAPAFRAPQVTATFLARTATIEVATDTPASLMRRCLADGERAIDSLARGARETAAEFRAGQAATAREALASLADSLGSLVGLVRAAGATLQVDLATLACGTRRASDLVDDLTAQLDALLSAHDRSDWMGLADLLDGGLLEALGAWRPVFEALADRADALPGRP